jgi:tetratricopeptide (TPR) repeat protein
MQRSSMAKISPKAIEEYRKILQKDVNSKAFAPLAEALRESGDISQAETVAANGIRRHPQYVGGYVALGRILIDQGRFQEAMPILKKASELDPENLLALQLLGTVHLQVSQPKEALKTFKRVLFLNPQSEKARAAVQKLESLTADDYEEDIFQYQSLKPQANTTPERKSQEPARKSSEFSPESNLPKSSSPTKPAPTQPLTGPELDRKLSLVDALIVRNDLARAHNTLLELHQKLPGNAEIGKRFELLGETAPEEEAAPLQPLRSREKMVVERKKRILENLLRRIKSHREESILNLSKG